MSQPLCQGRRVGELKHSAVAIFPDDWSERPESARGAAVKD